MRKLLTGRLLPIRKQSRKPFKAVVGRARGAVGPVDGDRVAEIVRCALMGKIFSFSRNHLWDVFFFFFLFEESFMGDSGVIWTVLKLDQTVGES